MSALEQSYRWWQRGVIYQIYPRSFMDANGDGVGDLAGVLSRLDYLEWLGVDAIWLSPVYASPMADGGYDVADYTDIDPVFGTLADVDRLLVAAHQRGLKVLLDFVPNHTSAQHPWFIESRSSRASAKRDWYIWHDPAPDGGPPNNWVSSFGGSAWEWDERTGQFYYHAFLKEQPDLNWRSPRVQEAMFDVLRFWLDRGVDGFRVDVIWQLVKDELFRDNPANPDYHPGLRPRHELVALYNADRPEVHALIAKMRSLIDQYDDRMMAGEIYLPVERLMSYYGSAGRTEVHLPFNFQLLELPWHAQIVGEAIDRYEARLPLGGWPNWVLGNHDRPRIASRVGSAQARVAAMLLLTLRGTPTLYYGDEIGMQNVPIPPDGVQDRLEWNLPGLGFGRDPERTPMQWSAARNAGFTTGRPWLPVAGNYATFNVEAERDDPRSILTLNRRLLVLRRAEPALEVGSYTRVPVPGDVLCFVRHHRRSRVLVALNLGPNPQAMGRPPGAAPGRIALSTHLDREGEEVSDTLALRPDEGVIVRLE
jgi:alpha-glucosidase